MSDEIAQAPKEEPSSSSSIYKDLPDTKLVPVSGSLPDSSRASDQ